MDDNGRSGADASVVFPSCLSSSSDFSAAYLFCQQHPIPTSNVRRTWRRSLFLRLLSCMRLASSFASSCVVILRGSTAAVVRIGESAVVSDGVFQHSKSHRSKCNASSLSIIAGRDVRCCDAARRVPHELRGRKHTAQNHPTRVCCQ